MTWASDILLTVVFIQFVIIYLGGRKMAALTQAITDLNTAISALATRLSGSATPAEVATAVTAVQQATAAVNALGN